MTVCLLLSDASISAESRRCLYQHFLVLGGTPAKLGQLITATLREILESENSHFNNCACIKSFRAPIVYSEATTRLLSYLLAVISVIVHKVLYNLVIREIGVRHFFTLRKNLPEGNSESPHVAFHRPCVLKNFANSVFLCASFGSNSLLFSFCRFLAECRFLKLISKCAKTPA